MYYNKSKYSDSQEDSTTFDSDSSRNTFDFSKHCRMTKSADNTSCSISYQSDSSLSDTKIMKTKQRNKKKNCKQIPPIGVFWDIENCQVPKNISAASIVKRIREFFFDGYREAEFIIVCDVKKESSEVIQDLHDAQVNLIHVSSISKNAADEKLRQSLRRFAEIFPPPSAVILISSDINFASDLSDLRYRKKLHVILVHKDNVADALMLCANETYNFSIITDNLPFKKPKSPLNPAFDLIISNLPVNFGKRRIRARLKLLSNNCGGKVVSIDNKQGTATLRFTSTDFLTRAQKRLKGEDVFGYKINVTNPTTIKNSPCKSIAGKKIKNSDFYQLPASSNSSSSNFPVLDTGSLCGESHLKKHDWSQQDLLNCHDSNIARAIKGSGNMLSKSHEQIWRIKRESYSERRSRTPQDSMFGVYPPLPTQLLSMKQVHSYSQADDSTESFQERNNFQSTVSKNQSGNSDGIDLLFSNLDSTIDVNELKSILMNLIKKYVMIISLNILTQMDGSLNACVRVGSQTDAQYIISQLHHFKLGSKRINVSYTHNNTLTTGQLKDMVIALLQEAPGKRMPLFKLLELLGIRYHINVSLSEVNKLKDICKITEERTGRVISLMPDVRTSPNSSINRSMLYCSVHCPNGPESKGWGELEAAQLPNIIIPFKIFAQNINDLLETHMGTLPLLSLPICYELHFGSQLPVNEAGVPLEHLITCVSNVELKFGGVNRNYKYLTTSQGEKQVDNDGGDNLLKGITPAIAYNIQLFCREVVDLLKTTYRCQLLFSRFVPAYHHHFGRQCRVADYGFTKLIDLLESPIVSNFIQILGDGTRRTITLTHNTQIRRFTSDLFRVLKSQVSKQILFTEFSAAYERTLSKPFNAVDYGLCSFEDLLEDLPEHTVLINRNVYPAVISIPKKEQTVEEVMRTKHFAEEVVKLLCHSPQYSMLFNKFVPAYHHHFGYQCRVSDYGFSKLIELFEAIPDTVKIEELPDGERLVRLTQYRAMQVLGSQIVDLITQYKLESLSIEDLSSTYLREYGYPLKPQTYEYETLEELLSKLNDYVKITNTSNGRIIMLAECAVRSSIMFKIWKLLIEPPHYLTISNFYNMYRLNYQNRINAFKVQEFSNVVKIIDQADEPIIQLTPFYIMAAEIYKLIFNAGGQILYNNLESKYLSTFRKRINVSECGVNNLMDLLYSLDFIVVLKGSRNDLTLHLNEKLLEHGIDVPKKNETNQEKYGEKHKDLQWPPPPIHHVILNGLSNKISPPKPDTPPENASSSWSTWTTPIKFESMNFHIDLPIADTPNLMGHPNMLISPTSFFSSSINMRNAAPPDPAELPMPDKLLGKGITSDDFNDSGVINNSNVTLEHEMELSNEENGAKPKTHPNYNTAYLTYRF